MQANPVREAIGRGEVQYGTWVNMVRNPAILTLLKGAGLDFARVDMEHSSPDMETLANMALLARALPFPIMVRPPEGNREWITRLLDAGVWNLHCPQVDTAQHAQEIVQASRYAPFGSRGMYNEGPAWDFESGGSLNERLKWANEQVFVTIMLETVCAFDHLDEMAAMPGMLTPEQMKTLDAARGAKFDELFLTGMIQHHKGALTMVADLRAAGGAKEPNIGDFTNQVDNDQRMEIVRMYGLLGRPVEKS